MQSIIRRDSGNIKGRDREWSRPFYIYEHRFLAYAANSLEKVLLRLRITWLDPNQRQVYPVRLGDEIKDTFG